jgi:hypothetical protein
MRATKIGFLLGLTVVLLGSALARAEETRKVQVQKGESLSEISEREVGRPVYGKRGSLQKLLHLNPQVKNPNYIRVGQWIFVPGTEATPPLGGLESNQKIEPVPLKASVKKDLLAIPLQAPKARQVSSTPEPRSLSQASEEGSERKGTTFKPFLTATLESLSAQLWLQARLDQIRRGEVVSRGLASSNVMSFRRFYSEQISERVRGSATSKGWSVRERTR